MRWLGISVAGKEISEGPVYHSAGSKTLGKMARASSSTSSSASPTPHPSIEASDSSSSQVYPAETNRIHGVKFNVDFHRVYHNGERLNASRLGYRVRYKAHLAGRRESAAHWSYGVELQYVESDGSISRYWLCRACHESMSTPDALRINGTVHITNHLIRKHQIDPRTGLIPDGRPTPENPWEAARVAGSSTCTTHTPWEEDKLQSALIDWAIVNDISFATATSHATRGLISWNRRNLLRALPNSPTTMASYVTNQLRLRQMEVSSLLEHARSKISVSVDVWTSRNYYSFLAVVAHFVDATYKQRDVLIAFRNLIGDHSGAAQAAIILDVIRQYNFETRFNCFIGDNATSNDASLYDGLTEGSDILNLDSRHRLRCTGHIINLVVKATLYGDGVSRFEEALAEAGPIDQFKLYRQHGIVGKLHNFVNAVCASHKRREAFKRCQKSLSDDDALWTYFTLNLVQAGGVRWHSTYLMLLRCRELREAIRVYQRQLRQSDTSSASAIDEIAVSALEDRITEDDWEEVNQLIDFLQVPYELTKRLEGNNSQSGFGSLWQTIPNLQTLWCLYSEKVAELEYTPDTYLKKGVKYGLTKLDIYWTKLVSDPDVSYYCIATMLHPKLRQQWFKTHWSHFPAYSKKADKSVRGVYELYRKNNRPTDFDADAHDDPHTQPSRRKVPGDATITRFDDIMAVDLHLLTNWKGSKKQRLRDELQEYYEAIAIDLRNDDPEYQDLLNNPWQWWVSQGQLKYPVLFKMACDFLSIPSTSCECERCFSVARRTITDDRNRLQPSAIEAIQLQKNWLRHGLIDSSYTEMETLIARAEKKRVDPGVNTSPEYSQASQEAGPSSSLEALD